MKTIKELRKEVSLAAEALANLRDELWAAEVAAHQTPDECKQLVEEYLKSAVVCETRASNFPKGSMPRGAWSHNAKETRNRAWALLARIGE